MIYLSDPLRRKQAQEELDACLDAVATMTVAAVASPSAEEGLLFWVGELRNAKRRHDAVFRDACVWPRVEAGSAE